MTSFDIKKYERNEKMVKLLFLWPTLLLLLFLIAYPFIMLIYYSFFNFSFLRQANTRFVGLTNYIDILTDTYTWERFIFTFKFVVIAVAIQFTLGILIARFSIGLFPFSITATVGTEFFIARSLSDQSVFFFSFLLI